MKTQLVQKGWKVDATYASTREADEAPPYGFKELICGNGRQAGRQAVCSARFLRVDKALMLTLRPKNSLLVDGAWYD